MKRLLLALLVVSSLTIASCSKEETEEETKNYAEAFVGDYTVSTKMQLSFPNPLTGQQQTISETVDDIDASIALNGDQGAVTITALEKTIDGTVDKDGLHIDAKSVDIPESEIPINVTFSFPTIKEPVNGTTSWRANLKATVTVGTIPLSATGIADQTATKK